MDNDPGLAKRFEGHRTHLRAVAYRMLGSLADADEAVQDTWLRASRAGAVGVENLGGWLTTIVARVCLNALQARKARREEPAALHLPDPIITRDGPLDPEHEVLLAESVGLALQIVIDTLPPAERLAFVLHDMFDVPFDDIGPLVGRSSAAARQLASRARRLVQGTSLPTPDAELSVQRKVVDAFFAAAHDGDLAALMLLLDPDVVLRSDGGERRRAASFVRHGAAEVARSARVVPSAILRPALVNGAAGVVVMTNGEPFAVMGFIVAHGKIVEIDVMFDPERLSRLDLTMLHGD